MALTALEIYKYLPKTNCRKCGFPTCLAFAMQIASGKVSLDKCPDVTAEAKAALDAASQPPIRLVTIGSGERKLEIGNEMVLFRHEKTFYHQPGVAVWVDDNDAGLDKKLGEIKKLAFERIGQKIEVEMVFLNCASGDAGKFSDAAKKVKDSGLIFILGCEEAEVMKAAAGGVKDKKPLLYCATKDNCDAMAGVAKESGCPLAVRGSSLDELSELTKKIAGLGVADLVLDTGSRELDDILVDQTEIRRFALKKNERSLGYTTIAFTQSTDPYEEASEAATYIAKYAGVVVVKGHQPWQILPLLTIRQNIYTDPQKPIQVEPKIYEVGQVDDGSPVLVTTNFSLTYFTVEGDVEASRIPCYILVTDTEGTSVLTAWAAEKFTAESIAAALKNCKLAEKVKHRNLIIPGYVSVLSGKLEDESGWKILVGPKESAGIPAYLKALPSLMGK